MNDEAELRGHADMSRCTFCGAPADGGRGTRVRWGLRLSHCTDHKVASQVLFESYRLLVTMRALEDV
jgi:hypothetical protein